MRSAAGVVPVRMGEPTWRASRDPERHRSARFRMLVRRSRAAASIPRSEPSLPFSKGPRRSRELDHLALYPLLRSGAPGRARRRRAGGVIRLARGSGRFQPSRDRQVGGLVGDGGAGAVLGADLDLLAEAFADRGVDRLVGLDQRELGAGRISREAGGVADRAEGRLDRAERRSKTSRARSASRAAAPSGSAAARSDGRASGTRSRPSATAFPIIQSSVSAARWPSSAGRGSCRRRRRGRQRTRSARPSRSAAPWSRGSGGTGRGARRPRAPGRRS